MVSHQEIVNEITQELNEKDNIFTLILYGSVSRHEENTNSDIDLLVITNEYILQKRHEVRYGITVEFVEMHLDFMRNFIAKFETPMLFTLANGKVLFNKIPEIDQLIVEAREILRAGPPINERWKDELYKTYKRSELTEIFLDLLDTDDEITFSYIATTLIAKAIPLLLENNALWPQTRKKTMDNLKANCQDGYKQIEILLKPTYLLREKYDAAKKLTEYALKPHGGILTGEAVIFKKSSL